MSFLLGLAALAQIALYEGEIDQALADADWPVELREEAKDVAWCESNWQSAVIGGQTYLGLFQLSPMWFAYAGDDINLWYDPAVNARAALAVYNYSGGWYQWQCQP